jgi:putative peptide zinc metalloprotease protein
MAPTSFDLVLPNGRRFPLDGELWIGRGPGNGLELPDPSVSRHHAHIAPVNGGVRVEDAGSSSGSWVDGMRVAGPILAGDGARIRLGNVQLVLERRRSDTQAGRTAYVPAGASAALPVDVMAPRLRSGYALKRLDASEGPRRWILKDLRGGGFVRLSDGDARLAALLDGQRTLPDLTRAAEDVAGPDAPMQLAVLIADLSAKGMLAGAAVGDEEPAPQPLWRRLVTPKHWTWDGAGDFFARLYRGGGWRVFTPAALASFVVVASFGVLAFAFLVAGRYGTPFVVANKIGLGGLVFLLGRLAIAAVHETAHALTMERFGRRVGTAGVKLVLIFPYVFVDTSDAWFESRRRRIMVSAAGPVSDLTLGGTFALLAALLPAGTLRDIFFQLAFAAYVGAVFNLNPFVPRDGYQILADYLREPRLRGGQRYAGARILWLAMAGLFSVAMSLHYEARFASLVPPGVAWAAMGVLWIAFFVPVVMAVRPVLINRARARGS